MEFWAEIQKPSPSVSRLVDIGTIIDMYATQCEALFVQQLTISPNSIQTIRRYAEFLLEVSRRCSAVSILNTPVSFLVMVGFGNWPYLLTML